MLATLSARIPRRNLGVDVDPDALDLGVFAHRVEAHLAAVAAGADAPKRRARIDALVRVDPDHACLQLAREAMRTLARARPDSAAESVFGAVGDAQGLFVVLEGQHGDEGAEDFFLRDAIVFALRSHDRRLDVATAREFGRGRRFAAGDDLAALRA